MHFARSASGVTAVELLIYLLLFSLTALLTLPTLGHTVVLRQRAKAHEIDADALEALARLLPSRSVSGFENEGLTCARVHNGGTISDGFGALHPVHKGTKALRPDPHSDAATFFHLALENELLVLDRTIISSEEVSTKLCFPAVVATPEMADYEYFIAVGIDGALEVSGSVTAKSAPDSRCANGRIFLGTFTVRDDSMYSPLRFAEGANNSDLIKGATTFVPIASHYTLYIDSSHNLRMLSHTSKENQPMQFHFGTLRINHRGMSAHGDLYELLGYNEDEQPLGALLLLVTKPQAGVFLNLVL